MGEGRQAPECSWRSAGGDWGADASRRAWEKVIGRMEAEAERDPGWAWDGWTELAINLSRKSIAVSSGVTCSKRLPFTFAILQTYVLPVGQIEAEMTPHGPTDARAGPPKGTFGVHLGVFAFLRPPRGIFRGGGPSEAQGCSGRPGGGNPPTTIAPCKENSFSAEGVVVVAGGGSTLPCPAPIQP